MKFNAGKFYPQEGPLHFILEPILHSLNLRKEKKIMSRWKERYEAFSILWQEVKKDIKTFEILETNEKNFTEEILRIKKAIKFLDGLTRALDPDLIPISASDSLNNFCQKIRTEITSFANTKQAGQLQIINSEIDKILTTILPYITNKKINISSLNSAINDAATEINAHYEELHEKTRELNKDRKEQEQKSLLLLDEAEKALKKIVQLEKDIFGDETNTGIKQKIDDFISDAKKKHDALSEYHTSVLEEGNETPSIKQQILSIEEHIKEKYSSIIALTGKIQPKIESIDVFYSKIFSTAEDNSTNKGLAFELELLRKNLFEFEKQQKTKYQALNNEIESLLPGASAVGLASAYHDMKKTFSWPIKIANISFFVSIIALVVLFFIEHSYVPTSINDLNSALKTLVTKASLYGPILWLAFYSSKRRSESLRLQQEYAHKEALAKSYNSYKKQIEALHNDDDQMLKNLMAKAIETISTNSAETLDKKHGDRHPIQSLAEKITDTMTKK